MAEEARPQDEARAGWGRTFLVAVQFLTRIPVPGGQRPTTPRTLARAVVFFPLVGALVAALTAGVMEFGALAWPLPLAALLALAVEALVTGAFHEDAVGDFFDAFGGGFTRERVLEILRDSRIGSFGTVAIALGLLLRAGAMSALPEGGLRFWAIVAAGAGGRLAILAAMALIAPVRGRDGMAKDVAAQATWRIFLGGGLLALPALIPLAWLAPAHAALAALFSIACTFYLVRLVDRRLGGITGDCLGCLGYIVQVLILLAAAAALPAASAWS